MAFKVFTDGSVLTASDVNDYLMRQSLVKCTDVTRPSSPDEGMFIWETNTDRLLYYSGSAWVIMSEPRQTWNPTITQLGVVSGTVNRGWYRRSNGEFTAALRWTSGGVGTSGNPITVSSPLTNLDIGDLGGTFTYTDTGTEIYSGSILPLGTTSFVLQSTRQVAGIGQAPAFGAAANDVIYCRISGTY